MIDTILIGILSIALFSLFVFVYTRETQVARRLKICESTIDNLNKTVIRLEKQVRSAGMSSGDGEQKGVEVNELLEFNQVMLEKVAAMQQTNVSFQTDMSQRVMQLEDGAKNHVPLQPTQSVSSYDEHKIVDMFNSGLTVEDIAKQLRVGSGEVEFVLKLRNYR